MFESFFSGLFGPTGILSTVWEGVSGFFGSIWEGLKDIGGTIVEGVETVVGGVKDFFGGGATEAAPSEGLTGGSAGADITPPSSGFIDDLFGEDGAFGKIMKGFTGSNESSASMETVTEVTSSEGIPIEVERGGFTEVLSEGDSIIADVQSNLMDRMPTELAPQSVADTSMTPSVGAEEFGGGMADSGASVDQIPVTQAPDQSEMSGLLSDRADASLGGQPSQLPPTAPTAPTSGEAGLQAEQPSGFTGRMGGMDRARISTVMGVPEKMITQAVEQPAIDAANAVKTGARHVSDVEAGLPFGKGMFDSLNKFYSTDMGGFLVKFAAGWVAKKFQQNQAENAYNYAARQQRMEQAAAERAWILQEQRYSQVTAMQYKRQNQQQWAERANRFAGLTGKWYSPGTTVPQPTLSTPPGEQQNVRNTQQGLMS